MTGSADLAWWDCFSVFESEADDDFYSLNDGMYLSIWLVESNFVRELSLIRI